jgi:hypothetical protein
MAKITISTNEGVEIKTIIANPNGLRHSEHAMLTTMGILSKIVEALDEALDMEERAPTDPCMTRET